MLNGKQLSFYTEACSFNQRAAVRFGNQTLCIASDGSGTVEYHDKFADLKGEDRTRLRNILLTYGAKFPCYFD